MDVEIKRKVLLVDDEGELLESIKEALELKGLQVLIATTLEDAYQTIIDHNADLSFIVCDYRLNDSETGFDLRKKMNPDYKAIPFCILSGFLTKELALEGIDHAICAFLEKPMVPESLYDLIITKSEDRFNEISEDLEMILEFRGDALSMLDEIEQSLLALESNPFDVGTVDATMRLLHTIKGTSGCLGLEDVQKFAHAYEDFFGPVKREEWPATKTVMNSALTAFDELKTKIHHMGDYTYKHKPLEQLCRLFELSADVIKEEAKSLTPPSLGVAGDSNVPGDQQAETFGAPEKVDEINVATELLDDFMEQSGELTVLRSMVVKHVRSLEQSYGNSATLERLVEALDEMHSVSSNMQNKIVDIRKVPMRNILRPLSRAVRDAASATNKEVNLKVSGETLRVDTSIGHVLTNSLVHMVRNAVDHGLEATAADREAVGKSTEGSVSIHCYEKGEDIIVELQDDGRGIDVEVVRAKCLEKELKTSEELEAMSENDIRAMIFEPGFSTAAQVTSVSGRGVGMDMVKSSVYEAGGQILIDSQMGKGTKFTLVLPIPKSVLIIRALFVESSGNILALNQDEIHKVMYIDSEKRADWLRTLNGKSFLQYDQVLIPVIHLGTLLQLCEDEDLTGADAVIRLVVMRVGKGFVCIAVDQVMDNEEIVVKPLARCLKAIGVYSGATFLGDGKTALVVDGEGLAKFAGVKIETSQPKTHGSVDSNDVADNKVESSSELLVVRSVASTEIAISLKDVFRLEDFRCSQIEYVGSQPVIQYSGEAMPVFELVERHMFDASLLEEGSDIKVIVVDSGDHLVGYAVQDIVDVYEIVGEMDTRVQHGYIAGSYFVEERIIPYMCLRGEESSAFAETMPDSSLEKKAS